MVETLVEVVRGGPLLLAIGVAVLAGLVSFLSPCVLPLVPGYLSYVTGLAGADLDAALGDRPATVPAPTEPAPTEPVPTQPAPTQAAPTEPQRAPLSPAGGVAGTPLAASTAAAVAPSPVAGGRRTRGRVLAGTLLFVAGFAAVFVTMAVLVTGVTRLLFAHTRALEVAGGVLIIVLGLAFLGVVPGAQRQWRISRLPAAGLLGAPVFGAVFALSWAPCVSPTLGAVMTLAATGGQTDRAVVLALAYCLGLGLPFVAFGLAFRRLLGVFTVLRRHSRWVTRVGGALLIGVGLALVTGGWSEFVIWLRGTVPPGEVGL